MEKIVLCWSSGDGYTYSCENTVPILFESIEAAMHMFEEEAWKGLAECRSVMFFAGHEFNPDDFFYRDSRLGIAVYDGPVFYTLEEWFDALQPH